MSAAHDHAYGPTGAGSVMLDVGDNAGALVIATGAEWHGREIEISRRGEDSEPRTHVAVRERHLEGGVRYTAVFPSLPAGAYVLWRNATEVAGTVVVAGGTVTEIEWWARP